MPFALRPHGGAPVLEIRVRLTPRAGRDAVEGVVPVADGRRALAVRVAAPPDKGRANAALIALLAREWGVAPSRLSLLRGPASRLKTVALAPADAGLAAALAARYPEAS